MSRKPRYRLVNGMRMPLGFPAGGLESGQSYIPAATDLFVASYPKCGTTWLQYIVYLLVRGRALGADDRLTDVFPHLEEVGADAVRALPEPRLIKTHLAFAHTPFSESANYLLIVRNPFDCAVSFFHHTRGFPRHYEFADGDFQTFFECFICGEVDFGDYFDHLESWLAQRERPNVAWLTYETLRADPSAQIRALAAWLAPRGIAGPAPLAFDDIVRETSLAAMQRNPLRWSSQRPDWAPGFVRAGSVGGWQELFTPGMAERLLAKCRARLGDNGLELLWPDIAAAAHATIGNRR